MSSSRESELNFGKGIVIDIPQSGNPVAGKTREALERLAQDLGTELIVEDGSLSISADQYSRYFFDVQGRVSRVEAMKRTKVNRGYFEHRKWNWADKDHDWGIERQEFEYDDQGRLAGAKTTQSTEGQLWRIMD